MGRVAYAGSALFCLMSGAGVSTPAPALPPDDLRFIVSEAQKVQAADIFAWNHYRFGRHSQREDYDDSGKIVGRDDLEFLITPAANSFREELIRHNGQPPDDEEIYRQRRAGGFNKHYRSLIPPAGLDNIDGGYSIGQLLHLATYRFWGREPRNGFDCYRLDFGPDDVQPLTGGPAAKVTRAMTGSLWITVEGFHLAGATAETVRPVSIALSLSKVYSMKIRMDSAPVGEGVWLPRRVEVVTQARFLFSSLHRRHLFSYSDYQRIPPPG